MKARLPDALKPVMRGVRHHMIAAAAFSALVNILYLAPSIYMMQVYDRVVPTGGVVTLLYLTLVIGLALGTLAALDQVRSRLMMKLGLRLDRLMAHELLERLLATPGGGSRVGQMMREFDHFRAGLSGPGALALIDIPWTPFYLLVAFMIHPLLGLLSLFAAVTLFVLAVINERTTKRTLDEAAAAMAGAYAAEEALGAQADVVRALGMRRAIVTRHLSERRRGLAKLATAQFRGGRLSTLTKFLRLFLQSLALGLGAWLAINKQISAGSIIAASILLSRSLQPVEQLVGGWSGVVQARTAFDHLCELFARTSSPNAPRTRLPDPKGELELDRVSVRAPNGQEVLLKAVSMRLTPGEIVGVVGPSGSGKTTLARIAANAIPPDAGEVRLEGARYADWDSDRLGSHIGYMPQEVSLLPGSVKENICRFRLPTPGESDRWDGQVIDAAKAAGVHEMILRLPAGYDTLLGPGQRGLSAGQSQRIALARALFDDPAVLILDEPNAYLDAAGEDALLRAIRAAKARGAATLIIAHRIGVLGAADRIAVLREGAVDRVGPRDEVLAEAARPRVASEAGDQMGAAQ
jgi:PrtD family type I secretion system ABC transporter